MSYRPVDVETTNCRDDFALLWAAELDALQHRLDTGDFLCCCGPVYAVGGLFWAYNSRDGWHDPSIEHDALWPMGGAA